MASALDDQDALRVHADELQERGDPRGELIAIGFERQRADRPELAVREAELVAAETARLDGLLTRAMLPQYAWRLGFVDEIALDYAGDEGFDALPVLASEPAFRRLRRLAINAIQMDGKGDMAPILADLAARAAAFPHLVEIVLAPGADFGNPWIDGPIDVHDVSPLVRAFPRLEVLELGGNDPRLGVAALPHLRRLLVHNVDFAEARTLAAATLPSLVDLDVAFWGNCDPLDRLDPLFDASFPALANLSFTGPPLAMPHILDRLPRSALARTIRRLRFATLADAWVPLLLAHASRLRRLEAVVVGQRGLAPLGRAALVSALGPRVEFI